MSLNQSLISDFSEYYRWSQRTKIKYKLHYSWCTGRRFTAATRHNTSCSDVLSGTRNPNMIRIDRGMEFRSKEVNKYLRDQNIHHFYALNTETKANYAERIIKSLKRKLFRYMMKHRTQRYIDVLQDVVYSNNHTIHRSLGKTPATITKDNEGESQLQQYLLRQPNIKSKKRYKKTQESPTILK